MKNSQLLAHIPSRESLRRAKQAVPNELVQTPQNKISTKFILPLSDKTHPRRLHKSRIPTISDGLR